MNHKHDRFLRLPAELQQGILEECLAASPFKSHPGPSRNREPELFPFTIAGVCKAWRALALDTPFLWTRITLDICSRNQNLEGDLHTRLQRCGRYPLSVRVTTVYRRGPETQEARMRIITCMETLFDLIFLYIDRISTLVIELQADLFHSLDAICLSKTATIDELHLHQLDDIAGRFYTRYAAINLRSRLSARRVCLEGYNHPNNLDINWGVVDQLYIQRGQPCSTLEILDRLPNLSKLDFQMSWGQNVTLEPRPLVALPALKELVLREDLSGASEICRVLVAESLTSLEICCAADGGVKTYIDRMGPFFNRSSAHLTTLRIKSRGRHLDLVCFMPLIQGCANLTHLSVHHQCGLGEQLPIDGLLRCLELQDWNQYTYSSTSPSAYKLRSLELVCEGDLNWNELVDSIASRRHTSVGIPDIEPLCHVSIKFVSADGEIMLDKDVLLHIMEFQQSESGCRISIEQEQWGSDSKWSRDIILHSIRYHEV